MWGFTPCTLSRGFVSQLEYPGAAGDILQGLVKKAVRAASPREGIEGGAGKALGSSR